MVYLLLGLDQVFSDALDVTAAWLRHLAEVQNVLVKALTLFSLRILKEGFLLEDCSALGFVRVGMLLVDINII